MKGDMTVAVATKKKRELMSLSAGLLTVQEVRDLIYATPSDSMGQVVIERFTRKFATQIEKEKHDEKPEE